MTTFQIAPMSKEDWEAERTRLANQRDKLIQRRAKHLNSVERCQRELDYTNRLLAQHYTINYKD